MNSSSPAETRRTDDAAGHRALDPILSPRRALMAAAILHVAAALVIFGVGRIQIFPQQFDHNGIGHFASDGQKFRVQTDVLTDTLLREGPMAWLKLRSEFHVRLYSLGFVLFRPLFG